jgi:hypothetical protein
MDSDEKIFEFVVPSFRDKGVVFQLKSTKWAAEI